MRIAGAARMRATLLLAAACAAAYRDLKACSGVDEDSEGGGEAEGDEDDLAWVEPVAGLVILGSVAAAAALCCVCCAGGGGRRRRPARGRGGARRVVSAVEDESDDDDDDEAARPPKTRKYRYAPRRGRGGDEQEVSLMPPRPGKPKKAGPFRSRGS